MGKKLIFLGLGIILATVLTWNNNIITDAEIIIRARNLGMLFPDEVESEIESQDDNSSNKDNISSKWVLSFFGENNIIK